MPVESTVATPEASCCFSIAIQCSHDDQAVECGLSVALHDNSADFVERHAARLHTNERRRLFGKFGYRRKIDFLLGRLAAKQAAAGLLHEDDFAEIDIASGVFNQPYIRYRAVDLAEVSISHRAPLAVALASPAGYCMGIDIDECEAQRVKVMAGVLTGSEIDAIKQHAACFDIACAQLWTVKEALSKVLKTGLTVPLEIYQTSEWEFVQGSLSACCFKNFYQYRACSWRLGNYALSVVLPRQALLQLDLEPLRGHPLLNPYSVS